MSRVIRRALRTELLRSAAPVAGIATLVVGAALMYSEANSWAGQWMPFAAKVRFSTVVLAPLAVGFGAWQGGRERRRRIGEQLGSTPRPPWQPLVLSWAGVTLGCWLGLLVVVVAGAALVAPVASYAGGGWWWLLAVTPMALAAMTAIGMALGRVARFWLVAPVALIVVYALQVYAHDDAGQLGGAEWLVPIVESHYAQGHTLSGWLHLQQALWFGGVAAAVLVLAAARRRWLAILPATLALTAVAPLLGEESYIQWRPDPVAAELVCTEDQPEVCLPRHEAFLLDDVAPVAREALARFEGVPGGPTRAVGGNAAPGGEPYLDIDTGRITITGELYTGGSWNPVRWWLDFPCGSDGFEHFWLMDTAAAWGAGDEPRPERMEPEVFDMYSALLAMPQADQKAWIGELIAAAQSCDQRTLDELAAALA